MTERGLKNINVFLFNVYKRFFIFVTFLRFLTFFIFFWDVFYIYVLYNISRSFTELQQSDSCESKMAASHADERQHDCCCSCSCSRAMTSWRQESQPRAVAAAAVMAHERVIRSSICRMSVFVSPRSRRLETRRLTVDAAAAAAAASAAAVGPQHRTQSVSVLTS